MVNIAREAAHAVWGSAEHAAEEAGHAVTGWFERPGHHRQAAIRQLTSQAPDVHPATVDTATQEEPMSLFDTLDKDFADVKAKLQGLDEDALTKVTTVLANPETADVLNDLSGLATAVGIPPGTITGVAQGLKTVLGLYAQPDPAQAVTQAAPAGQ